MSNFDLFGWLVSLNRKRARGAAYTFLIGCPLFLGQFVYRMTEIPWQLNRNSPVAISTGGNCSANGGTYSIVVRGSVFQCGGGDTKCAPFHSHQTGAYELDRPRHCRLLKNVGRPSLDELTELWLGLMALSFGGAFICWDAAWIDRLSAAEGSSPPPTIAYRLWRTLLWLSALALLATCIQEFALYSDQF